MFAKNFQMCKHTQNSPITETVKEQFDEKDQQFLHS